MADDEFDFHTPPRREAKQFEPPPWEREAFEEMERKRAEQQAAQEALAGAPSAQPQEAQQLPTPEPPAGTAREAAPGPGQETVADREAEAPEPRLDEAQVAEMIAGLSAEEPAEHRSLWRIAIASAIVVGAIGAVLIVWSMAAMVGARRTGAVGWASAFILLFFGAGFVAGAWWLTLRTLRQRGVL